jgi:hypothetical protein
MGRAKAKPQPDAVILPPDLDEDDDEFAGGGIPDGDGWIHLEGKEPKREDEAKPKRRAGRRNRREN